MYEASNPSAHFDLDLTSGELSQQIKSQTDNPRQDQS